MEIISLVLLSLLSLIVSKSLLHHTISLIATLHLLGLRANLASLISVILRHHRLSDGFLILRERIIQSKVEYADKKHYTKGIQIR